uniref:Uncharacterized protein n=1 Tax=Fagus sylvatica TaxID=28930 RepID=A0A2N9H7M2_FAGSY
MVLKTGPDRPVQPVQPGTGVQSGPPSFLSPHAVLPFSLCLSVSHSLSLSRFSPPASHGLTSGILVSLSLSRFLTSRSHFRRDLTSVTHGLDLSPSHLSGSRSHRRLSLLLAIPPLLAISPSPHACDLTATARPRSLSPTDPAKGHGTPIKLSLSLSHSHCQILVYRLFFFFPIFSL